LENNELEVRINVIPNYELESLILSFGDNVKVLYPQKLKDRFKEKYLNSAGLY